MNCSKLIEFCVYKTKNLHLKQEKSIIITKIPTHLNASFKYIKNIKIIN